MMNYHQSEIEALLEEVQNGNDLHRYNTRAPAAPLPYTRPGLPAYLNPTATQRHPSEASLQSQGYTNRQPLYESQDPQSSTVLTAPKALYARETQEIHTRTVLPQVQPQMSLGQYLNTPPNQTTETSSSPPTFPPSSPSLALTQRRNIPSLREVGQHAIQDRAIPPFPAFNHHKPQHQPKRIALSHAPPIVQGIPLVSPNELSDRFRSVFPFQLFNAVQSKCYPSVFESNDNLVISAPTGSGKTVILEMAICKLLLDFKSNQYKIIYMAPTKSLCSERQRDWQAKFASLDLQCAELTGDTDNAQLRHVQNSSIIITTPEKWDSMTRKWKDHARLMQLVKLFLIDEVHILKETRGATLEAVVSRMKSVDSDVRFVALSATVPNSEDIAQWLGKDPASQQHPARREKFGEEFRPVKLQKFVYAIPYRGNDFGFEVACDPKLPEIISRYSHKKPMMVFCMTRKSCVSTAKLLANLWASKGPRDRHWPGPTFRIVVQDQELKSTLSSGVAFHHAGLDLPDRHAVEKGFLEGQIHVICCTSTLAVGVNLPCHLVIIKNTVCFQDDGIKEYADLEIMQMLGRAGRPQYDDSAIAVIITKQEKAKKYEKMMSGEEVLESCLHLNLIEHLNAEVGLGTIHNLNSAKKWLAGSFLAVRLSQNPDHYKLDGTSLHLGLDAKIERICQRDLLLLTECGLLVSNGTEANVKCTEFGDAMARYCIKFETMKVLLSLGSRPKISEMLSALSQAEEYHDIRLKAGEKALYKEINKANGIKFPIKVDLALHAHKRSLLIQAELGGVEFPADEQYAKHKRQYHQDKTMVFSHINRLIRCVVDCQLHLQDAVGARHALELARSFSARVWDNSPLQMKQLPQIGLAAIRKLAMGGVNSIEALEATEPHRVETLMSKNPPFGQKLLGSLREFPKLRVSMKLMGKDVKPKQSVQIKIKVECGFLNDRPPTIFHRHQIYVCLLVERSDGLLVDFRRISAKKLVNGQDVLVSASLTQYDQYITSYVMCDEIAGTMRYAELKHDILPSVFPSQVVETRSPRERMTSDDHHHGRPLQPSQRGHLTQQKSGDNDFSDGSFDDQDFIALADANSMESKKPVKSKAVLTKPTALPADAAQGSRSVAAWNPTQLENGNWACNHKCKDKSACKHLCCRDGLEKVPKPPKATPAVVEADPDLHTAMPPKGNKGGKPMMQTTLALQQQLIEPQTDKNHTVEPARGRDSMDFAKAGPRDYKKLHRLHEKVNKGPPAKLISQTKPSFQFSCGVMLQPSFLDQGKFASEASLSSDYDDDWLDDLPSPSVLLGRPAEEGVRSKAACSERSFEDEISDIEAAMVGLDDSASIARNAEEYRTTTLSEVENDWNTHTAGEEQDNPLDDPSLLPGSLDRSKHERLFLSTDSPERPEHQAGKRRANENSERAEDNSSSPPLAKKMRITANSQDTGQVARANESHYQSPNSSQTMDVSTSGVDQTTPAPPEADALSALPEWTNDIEPEFLSYFVREYGHLVEWWPEQTQ